MKKSTWEVLDSFALFGFGFFLSFLENEVAFCDFFFLKTSAREVLKIWDK